MGHLCLICVIYVSLILNMAATSTIPEQQDFGPLFRPVNPTGARDILGYDNFQTTKNAKQEIKYGNHWEQYDTEPVQDFRFNQPSNNYNQRPLFNYQKTQPINNVAGYNQARY